MDTYCTTAFSALTETRKFKFGEFFGGAGGLALAATRMVGGRMRHMTAGMALGDIAHDALNHERVPMAALAAERLSHIAAGDNIWSVNDSLPPRLKLNVKGAKISSIYRRLHPDRPAHTIVASGGGGTHSYHWEQNRALTNRERARLQSFPDDFVFAGGRESVRKQIGMAVPPTGAAHILQAVLSTFDGILYESVEANLGTYGTAPGLTDFQEMGRDNKAVIAQGFRSAISRSASAMAFA